MYIDAFLTVYWFAMDQPQTAVEGARSLGLEDIPVVGAEVAWALAQIWADAGRTSEAVADAAAGYDVAARTLDAPHMRFNIADAEVSALLLAGRVTDALAVASRIRRQADDLPGAAPLLGAAVAGRAVLGAGDLQNASALLEYAAEGLSASYPEGWGYRYRIPLATALAMRGLTDEAAATLEALDQVQRRARSLDHERAWRGHGWPLARVPSARRSPTWRRRRKGPLPKGNSRLKFCVCKPRSSSVIAPARPGCGSSNRWSRGRGWA